MLFYFCFLEKHTHIGKVMLDITREELQRLLEMAFDKGYSGYNDLKEMVIQELLEKCKEKEEAYVYSSPSLIVGDQGWINPNWSINV
jgi:hypothetical protein